MWQNGDGSWETRLDGVVDAAGRCYLPWYGSVMNTVSKQRRNKESDLMAI